MVSALERLSESSVWKRQAAAYEALGQRAWSESLIAWRVTTCPWIAKVEAERIAEFDAEARRLGWLEGDEPLTICDVGAGTGRLVFHLKRELEARGINARFILTDVAPSNVAAYEAQGHLALQLDLLHDEPPELGPAVILAHYLFDSLPHSAWRNGGSEEGWVMERADGSFEWHWRPATRQPPHPITDDAPHLFPDGALKALDFFSRATGGRFLLLALDKGANETPTLARHETISAGVNFEALALAAPALTWLTSRQSPTLQLAIAVPRACASRLEPISVDPLLAGLETVTRLRESEATTLDDIVAVQAELQHDPDTLTQLADRARQALPSSTPAQVEALVLSIARAAGRHFVFKQQLDVPFTLATLAHASGALVLAEALYALAVRESGEQAPTLYNLSLLMRATGRPDEAEVLLQRALDQRPG